MCISDEIKQYWCSNTLNLQPNLKNSRSCKMCLPIHQCSSFPRNVLHTCTTINLQKACKSSMTFSPSNHYTPSDSFLLFLSTPFNVRFPCALSLSLSLSLSLFSLLFFFAIMDLGLQHQNSLPTSTYE